MSFQPNASSAGLDLTPIRNNTGGPVSPPPLLRWFWQSLEIDICNDKQFSFALYCPTSVFICKSLFKLYKDRFGIIAEWG